MSSAVVSTNICEVKRFELLRAPAAKMQAKTKQTKRTRSYLQKSQKEAAVTHASGTNEVEQKESSPRPPDANIDILLSARSLVDEFENLYRLKHVPLTDERIIAIREKLEKIMPNVYKRTNTLKSSTREKNIKDFAESVLAHFPDVDLSAMRPKAEAIPDVPQLHSNPGKSSSSLTGFGAPSSNFGNQSGDGQGNSPTTSAGSNGNRPKTPHTPHSGHGATHPSGAQPLQHMIGGHTGNHGERINYGGHGSLGGMPSQHASGQASHPAQVSHSGAISAFTSGAALMAGAQAGLPGQQSAVLPAEYQTGIHAKLGHVSGIPSGLPKASAMFANNGGRVGISNIGLSNMGVSGMILNPMAGDFRGNDGNKVGFGRPSTELMDHRVGGDAVSLGQTLSESQKALLCAVHDAVGGGLGQQRYEAEGELWKDENFSKWLKAPLDLSLEELETQQQNMTGGGARFSGRINVE